MTERIYGDQNFRFDTASEAVLVTQVGADGDFDLYLVAT